MLFRSNAAPLLGIAATGTVDGGRLASTNSVGKDYAIGVGFGADMICSSYVDVVSGDEGVDYVVMARHYKGDTAYGIDSDAEGVVYTVSNPNAFPSTGGLVATGPAAATVSINDFCPTNVIGAEIDGNGSPTLAWTQLR